MGVSENGGTPKSSNLIGISIINHPFWGVSLFLETPIFSGEPCDMENGRQTKWISKAQRPPSKKHVKGLPV